MKDERKRKAIETALKRRRGATPEKARKIKENMLDAKDLRTTCQKCKAELVGTLESLQRHAEACDGGTSK